MIIEEIESAISELLGESQYLIEVQFSDSNQIRVYIDDFNGLSISECKRISKGFTTSFDREIEDYSLEISSPGLEKSFKVVEQYKKSINKTLEVLLKDGIKYQGVLVEIEDTGIYLEISKKISKKENIKTKEYFEFNQIKKANLIIDF